MKSKLFIFTALILSAILTSAPETYSDSQEEFHKTVKVEEGKRIEIHNIKLIKYKWPNLKIRINCSSGTYIRSLAYDIGRKLNSGAYLDELCRITIGNFKVKNSIDLKKLTQENWKKYLLK